MAVHFFLFAAVAMSPNGGNAEAEQAAANALVGLNNYLDALSFSDACLDRSDAKVLEPLRPRIEAARDAIISRYPTLVAGRVAGDTDWTCDQSVGKSHRRANHKAIRAEVTRLILALEAAVLR
jgi:hypothetical protein